MEADMSANIATPLETLQSIRSLQDWILVVRLLKLLIRVPKGEEEKVIRELSKMVDDLARAELAELQDILREDADR